MSIRPISVLVKLLVTSYHFICDSLNIECNLITFCNDVLVPLLLYFDSGKLVNFGTEDGLCFDPCFDFSSLNDIEDLLFLHFKNLYKYITKSQHSCQIGSRVGETSNYKEHDVYYNSNSCQKFLLQIRHILF